MNLRKYRELAAEPMSTMRLLAQDATEWFLFLEFVSGYFKSHGINKPIVVEIGIMHNAQKAFYEELLNAVHIGIDINPNCSPDILGDSHEPETMRKLEVRLAGRKIDLLFIDADHSYASVKRDYELFAPLTKHIIAFHDIFATVHSDVLRFWQEISKANGYLAVTISKHNTAVSIEENKFVNMGIGVIIKG